jgi:acetaldehyde dehydrogenase/alcohol dehydrogenase
VIPTTSGTGSEVTSYTVITDESKNLKIALHNDKKFANVALLDCNLIKTVPPQVTAETGMDILSHAIESFVSNQASDYTDALAQMSIEMVFSHLVTCYKNGSDDLSREKIHNASCMAGMAFENSSLGLNHSMAHTLGARFKIAHGRANAVLLPYVIRYNSGLFDDSYHIEFATANKYCKITRLLHLPTQDLREGVTMLAKAIMTLNNQMDIAVSIRDLGIEHHEFERALPDKCSAAMADVCTQGNPRIPCEKDIMAIFRAAYDGQG